MSPHPPAHQAFKLEISIHKHTYPMRFSTVSLLTAFLATVTALAADDLKVSPAHRSSLLSRAAGAGVCNGEDCCDHGLPCNRVFWGGNCCPGLECCGSILNPVMRNNSQDLQMLTCKIVVVLQVPWFRLQQYCLK